MNAHMCLQVEVEREPFRAKVALVRLLSRMHQHVSLKLCIIQKALTTAVVRALEELVSMNSVVLLQRCPIVENLST